MRPADASALVKQSAVDLGFDACGITAARAVGRADYLAAWLAAGRAGSMGYLHRNFHTRANPQAILDGAKSVIVVALQYKQPIPQAAGQVSAVRGRVAMYAWGGDYHEIMKDKLRRLVERLRVELSQPFDARVCVDTAPLLERELAAAAGVGWIGKNTMVLNRTLGSYFFLGEIVTTLDLAYDEALTDRCGSCTACLDACPTGAFPAHYEMDASRCISYLTIEHRGDIPASLQEHIGAWMFGCDVCQEVCPYNRRAPLSREPGFAVRPPAPDPVVDDILAWTPHDYRSNLRGSAMQRARLDMLQRNARIVRRNVKRAADPEDTVPRGL